MPQASFVVTGGAQGVGEAITRRLAQLGPVIVLDLTEKLTWDDPAVELASGDARDPQVARVAANAPKMPDH